MTRGLALKANGFLHDEKIMAVTSQHEPDNVPTTADDESRAHGRLPQEGLKSSHGGVINLSAGGACIINDNTIEPSTRKFEIEFWDDSNRVRLVARVVWMKRRGKRQCEVGLRFVDVTREQSSVVTRLGMTNRMRLGVAADGISHETVGAPGARKKRRLFGLG